MYTNHVESFRKQEAIARDQLSRATEFLDECSADLAESKFNRAQKLRERAELCNDVIHRLQFIGKMGTLADATKAILSSDALTPDEMEALLWFAPEWGNHLYSSGAHPMEKPAYLYQVEIVRHSDGEAFYKVGHTGSRLDRRITALGICRKTYTVNVHHSIPFRKKRYAEAEEKRIHDQNVSLRYLGTPFLDNGHTEVYSQPILSNRLRLEISLYSLLGISRD
jgi:hypothetical protein